MSRKGWGGEEESFYRFYKVKLAAKEGRMGALKPVAVALAILFICATPVLAEELEGKTGYGIFGSYYAPLSSFRDMYDQGGKFGASINYVVRPSWMLEVEGHYAMMTGGKLKDAKFTFPGDRLQYPSDRADTEMFFMSVMVNWLYPLGKEAWETENTPYVFLGAGFNHYDSKVSGLVWAGQKPPPDGHPDLTRIMETTHDSREAVALSGGIGYQIFTGGKAAVDLRARYSLVLGELRPFGLWGIERTHPFHLFDIGLGLKFFR